MTLRVYKDEYSAAQIDYISTHFEVESSTESILQISGKEEDLEKVMIGMYASEEQFKKLFPDFLTKADRKAFNQKAIREVKSFIQTTLLHIIQDGEVDEEFMKLKEVYFNL